MPFDDDALDRAGRALYEKFIGATSGPSTWADAMPSWDEMKAHPWAERNGQRFERAISEWREYARAALEAAATAPAPKYRWPWRR